VPRERVLSALILLPPVLLATYLGGVWFYTLVLIAVLLASFEFVQMSMRGGYRPSWVLIFVVVILFLVQGRYPSLRLIQAALAGAVILSFIWQIFRTETERSLVDWALTLAGGLYLGWLGANLVSLRDLPNGFNWTMWMFLVTWTNDSGAYLVGRAFGRHLFSPRISPHKTWEGSIGGWTAGALMSLWLTPWLGIPVWHGLLVGFVMAVLGSLGDLAVSFLKRRVGVKDSGALIPGHGGMLDRVDSLLFATVVAFTYASWVTGQ